MLDSLKAFFFYITTPFQIFLQRIGKQEPKITSLQVTKFCKLIKRGDIILSYESGRPTSVFIRGFYDHAVIVTNKLTIMEAVGDKWVGSKNVGGVREVNLIEWLYKKDSVCVIRPVYNPEKVKLDVNTLASKAVYFYKGLNYDYGFDLRNETIYCSELVYASYIKYDPQFLEFIPAHKEILPMDYYSACSDSHRDDMFFQIIHEVRN